MNEMEGVCESKKKRVEREQECEEGRGCEGKRERGEEREGDQEAGYGSKRSVKEGRNQSERDKVPYV